MVADVEPGGFGERRLLMRLRHNCQPLEPGGGAGCRTLPGAGAVPRLPCRAGAGARAARCRAWG
eukprot:1845083-Alexandrium_andersonii.AAC.1